MRRIILVGLALMVLAMPVGASDPIGVYGVVQKVVFEPDECAPLRVQVWGAFSMATRTGNGYAEPQRGYLYYSVPPGPATTGKACEREWMDFKLVAGTGEAVAFASRHLALGRVRAANEKPANPDPYPLHNGVWRLGGDVRSPWLADLTAKLKKAAGAR